MAFTSFTIRKTTVGFGSYVRANGRTDGSLRADGVSSVALTETGNSTFSANILNPTTVRLEWSLGETLAFESDVIGASVASPVALVIVSSTTGEPITVADGSVVTTITASTGATIYDDVPATIPGRWVYYSLFVKYQADVDYWYNREATLYIQLPTQHQSVESLWSNIPMYYRNLDEQQTPLESGYTPLYGFLELFGNELDRTRTLIDSVALSNDPNLAVTPALEQLAYQTGLEVGINDLGTTKTRSLLNNIGTLRQRKGTIGNIISYISSMTGCGASYQYDYSPSPTVHHIFHVLAQRINFISDPTFEETTYFSLDDSVDSYYRSVHTASTWNVVAYTDDSSFSGEFTVTNTNEGIVITLGATWSGDEATVLVFPVKEYPYVETTTYYCSYDTAASAGASFSGVHLMSTANATGISATIPFTGLIGSDLYLDTTWNNTSTMPSDSSSRRVFEYAPNAGASFNTIYAVPVLEFKLVPGSSAYIGRWLWEPSFVGEYFDGSTRDGGYIPSTSGTAGDGVFDYFWGDGGTHADYSYYLLDRQRTIETTERVLSQYVIPVTMVNDYTLDWNYYIGK
jgi:hypothetical protein